MHVGLIVIGDEILSGKRADKHLPKVIELLTARGLALAWARFEPDDPARITDALRVAFATARDHGDVVFSCGGIGATPDDHTRQCAAAALGVPLELHPEARDCIVQRMRDLADEQGQPFDAAAALGPEHEHRMNMARFPAGASIIPNPYNRIAGFAIREPARAAGGAAGGVYFVPGFPVMAWPMIEWVLDTHHPASAASRESIVQRSVIVYGGMEAVLTPLMLAVEAQHPGARVFSLPSVDRHGPHGVHIELGVKAPAPLCMPAFEALLVGLKKLRAALGPVLVH